MVLSSDTGGKHFARDVVLSWLVNTGGSNLKVLETATGLPQKLLSTLLTEMMLEKVVRLDKVVFKPVLRR